MTTTREALAVLLDLVRELADADDDVVIYGGGCIWCDNSADNHRPKCPVTHARAALKSWAEREPLRQDEGLVFDLTYEHFADNLKPERDAREVLAAIDTYLTSPDSRPRGGGE